MIIGLTLGHKCGVLLILTILFVPETAYVRSEVNTINNEDDTATVADPNSKPVSPSGSGISDEKVDQRRFEDVESSKSDNKRLIEKPYSALRLMRPWEGKRFSDENFFKITLRPFTLLLSPVVAWGTLVYGTTSAWREFNFVVCLIDTDYYFIWVVVALSVSVSTLFSSPEFGYNFEAGTVGLIAGIGPFIAAFLGNVLAGPLSDWLAKWMSRRNGGVYEPECVVLY